MHIIKISIRVINLSLGLMAPGSKCIIFNDSPNFINIIFPTLQQIIEVAEVTIITLTKPLKGVDK